MITMQLYNGFRNLIFYRKGKAHASFLHVAIRLIFTILLYPLPVTLFSQNVADSGLIYYQQGISETREYKFTEGREALLKAQLWFYREKDYLNLGKTFIQLGFQTNRLGIFEESIAYFKKADDIAHTENIPELLFYANVAKSLTYLWEYQLTRDTLLLQKGFNKLLHLKASGYSPMGEVQNDYLETWGDYYLKTGKLDSAQYYFEKSLALARQDSNQLSVANCYINKAWIASLQGKERILFANLDSAKNNLGKEKNYLHERRINNLYYYGYKRQGNYSKALSAFEHLTRLKHKELLADRELALTSVTNEYERLIMREELAAHETMLLYHKRLIIIIFSMLLVAILFIILYFRLYRENKRISNKNSILLKEQNHRLKNNLQIISGLLSLQANRIQEDAVRDIIEASQYRVHAIGLIHKQLYEQGGEEVELQQFAHELINQIIVSFGVLNLKKEIKIETINLPAEVVNSLGLILNELITNSCKYAFGKTKEPSLFIKIHVQEDGSISLVYKDNGPGFNIKAAQGKPTFGLTLINIQVAQLEGKSRWKGTDGLFFSLVFRVEKKLSLKDRIKGKKAMVN